MRMSCRMLLLATLMITRLAQARTVVYRYGRTVEVPDHPQRIVLGESRMLYTLSLVQEGNPAKNIVGWPGDMQNLDPQSWQLYVKAFPEIATIPQLGKNNFTQFNAEKIIALKPDLVILPRYAKQQSDHDQMLDSLTQAGIAVIYVDLRVDQLNNTI